jgi:hypothetical protein
MLVHRMAATTVKLQYTDSSHAYWLDGRRCKGVTTVAKIPVDDYAITKYDRRQVAIGLALEPNLIENIAMDLENRDIIDSIVDDAKKVAKAHHKADRGSQMHRVLELILLGEDERLITEQQQRDRDLLLRTLDLYKLTPHDGLIEQFVVWPEQVVAGRFDAVLEKPDGRLWLVDLKSGPNAVKYPQSTAVQLALYARAPHVSLNAPRHGDKQITDQWRTMPDKLDRQHARVLLVQPDAEIGELHRIDIQHGWAGAMKALEIVRWRKQHNNGRDIATTEPADDPPREMPTWETLIRDARGLDDLRLIWTRAHQCGDLTPELRQAVQDRTTHFQAATA